MVGMLIIFGWYLDGDDGDGLSCVEEFSCICERIARHRVVLERLLLCSSTCHLIRTVHCEGESCGRREWHVALLCYQCGYDTTRCTYDFEMTFGRAVEKPCASGCRLSGVLLEVVATFWSRAS